MKALFAVLFVVLALAGLNDAKSINKGKLILMAPCTHTMLSQRLYNVYNVGTTSNGRLNDVVCLCYYYIEKPAKHCMYIKILSFIMKGKIGSLEMVQNREIFDVKKFK